MEIEKSGCICKECHTEVPATPAAKTNKPSPNEVGGGIVLCVVLFILGCIMLEYMMGD